MSLAPTFRAWLHATTRLFDRASPAWQAFAEPPHARLAGEDWDLLLRAVLDRLEHLASQRGAGDGARGEAAVLRECAAALNQLAMSGPGARRR